MNAPIKRHRVADWIKKQKPSICCLQETHLIAKGPYRLKVKGWEMIFHANRQDRKAGGAILISDKIDFKMKAIKKDKEGHYLMVKGSIEKEDITIVNAHAHNMGAPKYIQQILTDIKEEIDGNTIRVGDFNTPLTSMDRSSRQKVNKTTQILNDTIEKLDLTFSGHCIQKNQNIHSSQVHMEHFQGSITYWSTKLTSTNLRV